MIDERKSSREAKRLLQLMEVSIELPHDMLYRQGAAKFSVSNLLYLGRPERQIIWNLRRGNNCCARPRAKRGRNGEIIPFCSSYPVTKSATSECQTA